MEHERRQGPPISREVEGGFIAHQVAFSEEGIMVFDSKELAQERHENRTRLANPNNGYQKMFRPFNGNQEVYDAAAKVAREAKGFGQGKKPPRGYTSEFWNAIDRKNSKKEARKAG